MKRIVAAILLGVCQTALLSGCGAMENLCADGQGPTTSKVYGGVERDWMHAREIYGGFRVDGQNTYADCTVVRGWPYHAMAFFQTDEGRAADSALQKWALGPWLLAVDLPASALVDTLTLPVAVAAEWRALNRIARKNVVPAESVSAGR